MIRAFLLRRSETVALALVFIGVLAATVLTVVVAVLASTLARAEPAQNFPLQHHDWLQGLRSPPRESWPSGEQCCNQADCSLVVYRLTVTGYQARYADMWLDIPADRIVRAANPTGSGVLCLNVHRMPLYVYCLIPAGEG